MSENNELTNSSENVSAQTVTRPKKKYTKPTLTEPEGVLKTTKFFFFQANGSGGTGRREGPPESSR